MTVFYTASSLPCYVCSLGFRAVFTTLVDDARISSRGWTLVCPCCSTFHRGESDDTATIGGRASGLSPGPKDSLGDWFPRQAAWAAIIVAVSCNRVFSGVVKPERYPSHVLLGAVGRSDPLFSNDLGFYVFSLPFYELIKDWALLVIFLSGVIAVCIYVVRGDIDYQQTGFPTLSSAAMRHLSALLASYFLVKAAGYILQRYDLLTSNNGIVFGAAYTDVHLRLPLLIALAGAAFIAAALCAYNIWQAACVATRCSIVSPCRYAYLIPEYPELLVKPTSEARVTLMPITSETRATASVSITHSAKFPARQAHTAVLAANQATSQNIRWGSPPAKGNTGNCRNRLYTTPRHRRRPLHHRRELPPVLLSAREGISRNAADAQTWINSASSHHATALP